MRRNRLINLGYLLANLALFFYLLGPPPIMAVDSSWSAGALEPPAFWIQEIKLPEEEVVIIPPMTPIDTSRDPKVFHSLPTQDRVVVLTIDDGPTQHTPAILKILAEKDVPASFFLLGTNVLNRPDYVRDIYEAGHEIGNHSWSHPNLAGMERERIHWQLGACTAAIEAVGAKMRPFFRPPYGARDDTVYQVARELGYHMILWDVDTRDWEFDDPKVVLERSLNGLKPGSIVLFHDGPKVTLDVLPLFIDEVRARGYQFVLLSDYIK